MNQTPIETKNVISTGLLNIAAAINTRTADSRYGPLPDESPAPRTGAAR
jgi:hypothetical protein